MYNMALKLTGGYRADLIFIGFNNVFLLQSLSVHIPLDSGIKPPGNLALR